MNVQTILIIVYGCAMTVINGFLFSELMHMRHKIKEIERELTKHNHELKLTFLNRFKSKS